MNAGLIAKWDALEWKVTLDASGHSRAASGTAVLGDVPGTMAAAGLISYYETDPTEPKAIGISLEVRTIDTDGGGTHPFGSTRSEAQLIIPFFDIDTTEAISASWEDDIDSELIFSDVALYQTGGGWSLYFNEMEWKVNGSTVDTLVFDDFIPGLLVPAGVPLFGIPPRLGATATIETAPAAEPLTGITCDWDEGSYVDGVELDTDSPGSTPQYLAFSKTAEVSATASGGWRVLEGINYRTFAVNVSLLDPPTTDCSSDYTEPSATNTYNGSASANTSFEDRQISLETDWADPSNATAHFEVAQTIFNYDTNASSVMLLPDLAKGVNRIAPDDYAALILAGGMPEVTASADAACCLLSKESAAGTVSDDSSDPDPVTDSIFPETDRRLVRVTGAAHEIEDVFGIATYAPASATATRIRKHYLRMRLRGAVIGPYDADYPEGVSLERAGVSSEFAANVEVNADCFGYLEHTYSGGDKEIHYLNYSASPHWSFVLFFPNNDDADFWKVDGSKVNSDDYWLKAGEQWFQHTDIEGADDTETRNFVIAEPLISGNPSFYVADAILGEGAKSAFWGITRFRANVTEPTASIALTSSSSALWSATDATLAHGGSITVNPSAINCVVDLELGSFAVAPYLYPHLSDRITVGWSVTNVAAMSVKLVTPDGSEVEIATAPGTYARPIDTEAKYAGSWAQDYGIGAITDEGADTEAEGVSATVMADPERNVAFLLINGRTEAILRFEIEVVDHTVDVTLNYPEFLVSATDAALIPESAQVADILYPNGPGLRYGQWDCSDESGILQDPQVRDFGSRMTVVDGLVWNNLVLLGVAKSTGLNAAIEALYDAVELGGASGDGVRLPAIASTHAFLVPGNKSGILLLVNGEAEVPPLACWPMHTRNADYSLTTGSGFEQASYSHTAERRYIVGACEILHLDKPDPGRTRWTTEASGAVPTGWFASYHKHVVGNSEGDGFLVAAPDRDIATASPYHGYFGIYCVEGDEIERDYLSADISLSLRKVRSYVVDGEIKVALANDAAGIVWQEIATGIEGTHPVVRWERNSTAQKLFLLYIDGSANLKLTISLTEGVTWAVAATIASGTSQNAMAIGANKVTYVYWRTSGGAINGKLLNDQGGLIYPLDDPTDGFEVVASGVEDKQMACAVEPTFMGGFEIVLHYYTGGNLTQIRSVDGIVFS